MEGNLKRVSEFAYITEDEKNTKNHLGPSERQ